MRQKVHTGYSTSTSTSATRYTQAMCGTALSGTETFQLVPTAGTFRCMRVYLSAAPGTAGSSYTITLRVEAADTAVTVTINHPDQTGSYTGAGVAVTAGQRISIGIVPSAGTAPTNTATVAVMLEFQSDTANEVILMGGMTGVTGAGPQYSIPSGLSAALTTEVNSECIMPMAGTITYAYAYITSAITGSGRTRTFSIRLNEGDPTGASNIVFNSGESGLKSASQNIAVAAGDRINWKNVASSSAAGGGNVWLGLLFKPTTDNLFPICASYTGTIAAGLTRYLPRSGCNGMATSEAGADVLYDDIMVDELHAYLSVAAGAGKSVTITPRKYSGGAWGNDSNPPALTMTNTQGPSSSSGTVNPTQLLMVDTKIVTDSGAATTQPVISYLAHVIGPPSIGQIQAAEETDVALMQGMDMDNMGAFQGVT